MTFTCRAVAAALASTALCTTAALADGGRITVTEAFDIGANWAMYSSEPYIGMRAGCYEGLTRVGHDLRVEPLLATSWEQTSDNTWVFQIREGVTFQDGTPLDAAAVAGALTHLLNAPVPARAFNPKVATSVEATGAMEVTITTPAPQVSMPGRLGAPESSILAPAAYVSAEEINPIGHCTGPYEITEVDPSQFIKVDRFDGYWGEAGQLDGADFLFVPDGNTRATMARTGEAHISRLLPATAAMQVDGTDGVSAVQVRAPRVAQVLLNNSKPPFDNADARRAVRAALDVQGVAAAIYEGLATPANDSFRDGEPWDTGAMTKPASQEEAASYFEKAGIDPKTLELEFLVYNSKPALAQTAEVLQAALGELGVTVNIKLAEWSAIEGDLYAGNHNMAMMSRGYMTDVPEPIGFFSADLACEGVFNVSQHCNPLIDKKIAMAAAEPDTDKRYGLYQELAQYIYDEAVTVNVINETQVDGVSDAVMGYVPHPLQYQVLSPSVALK